MDGWMDEWEERAGTGVGGKEDGSESAIYLYLSLLACFLSFGASRLAFSTVELCHSCVRLSRRAWGAIECRVLFGIND